MPGIARISALIFAVLFLAIVAACGEADEDATATPSGGGSGGDPTATATAGEEQPALDGTAWLLEGMNGVDMDLQYPITLEFEDGQASGFAGCNDYSGAYTAEPDGTFTMPEIIQTDMDCETGMDIEAEYLDTLGQAARYAVIEEARLELANEAGETVLVFTIDERLPLDGTSWNVIQIDGEPTLAGTTVDFTLRAGEISGSGGCNRFGGRYTADAEGNFSTSELFWTEMGCGEPEGVMDQEQAFFAALGEIAGYRHDSEGGTLTLIDGDEQPRIVATVNGQEADTGIYGSPGWVAESLRGQAIEDDLLATIRFDASQFAGTAGCIGYTGIIDTEPGGVITRIEPAVSPCENPETSSNLAEDYMAALEDAAEYREVGDALEILDSAGEVLIVYRPAVTDHQLEGTLWTLATLNGEPVLSDSEATAEFSDGSILGSASCNSYGAVYIVPEAGTVAIAPAVSTLMLCAEPEGIMDQEAAYIQTLRHVHSYRLAGETLEMLDGDGEVLLMFEAAR